MRIVALLQFLYVNSRLKTAMKSKHLYILFLLLYGQVFSTVAQYNQSLTNYTLLKNNPEDLIPVTDLSLHTFEIGRASCRERVKILEAECVLYNKLLLF